MTFETARRVSEILLAIAFLQQALEHLFTLPRDRVWVAVQLPLTVAMASGVAPVLVEGALLLVSVDLLRHFRGPYNGGSDRVRLLILSCLWLSHLAPNPIWAGIAVSYLAVQIVLSYTLAGYVKLANPEWRRGQALADVFAFSVYPVSDALQSWAGARGPLLVLSWLTILFEVLFPLALLHPLALTVTLAAALGFHVANACLFGLNRFVWSWLAAYPCLLWFQQAVVQLFVQSALR